MDTNSSPLETFVGELPALIVTLAVFALIAVLLLTGVATVSNPLIDIVTAMIIPFWFQRVAYQWQPSPTKLVKTLQALQQIAPPAQPTPVPPAAPGVVEPSSSIGAIS